MTTKRLSAAEFWPIWLKSTLPMKEQVRSTETYACEFAEAYASAQARRIANDVANLLVNVAQILDVVKGEWGESWSAFDQEQRDAISKHLHTFYEWQADAPGGDQG